MDIGILAALAMLVAWVIGALVFDGPGWVHLLLSVGVTMLLWRIVVRSTPAVTPPTTSGTSTTSTTSSATKSQVERRR
jgi:hypothetical protein